MKDMEGFPNSKPIYKLNALIKKKPETGPHSQYTVPN